MPLPIALILFWIVVISLGIKYIEERPGVKLHMLKIYIANLRNNDSEESGSALLQLLE